ncbi:ROK family protein [Treponema brennaborense]|uniref:ROK family protein n=1 Tax=Treponema brennaborense (strain DSM 12168 / CIP 105900 / DD5/3) TaxID=906968 RepID=F4LM24_TREBD|nr:ROK family protein [Treponema brennaborense]AEE16703.1 ROK family protein [Treponema brennaborense DSM 12168]
MEKQTAHFNLVKMQNCKVVRNLLRAESPLGIGALSKRSGLTYPTVSSLIKDLLERNEVSVAAGTESSGGRPGARYALNASYQFGLVLYFDHFILRAAVCDSYGIPTARFELPVSAHCTAETVSDFVCGIRNEFKPISAVALGIPGIVDGSEITHVPRFPLLEGTELAALLETELQAAVFIENDVNATAFAQTERLRNFAHVAYVNGCIGTGIVLDGKLFRGAHGFAGELESVCSDLSDAAASLTQCVTVLTCVLDVPDVLVSGERVTDDLLRCVRARLSASLPANRIPRLQFVPDMLALYEAGLRKMIVTEWCERT